eukprot:2788869-Amphidinium_carterae.1
MCPTPIDPYYSDYRECAIPVGHRYECGWKGITESQCVERRGCCWDVSNYTALYNGSHNIPKCYCPMQTTVTTTTVDCPAYLPWRDPFYPELDPLVNYMEDEEFFDVNGSLLECRVEPHHRHACGYAGITRHECERQGCCYDPQPFPNPMSYPYCFCARVVQSSTSTLSTLAISTASASTASSTEETSPSTTTSSWRSIAGVI